MIRRPPRSTLFPYTTALPIYQQVGIRADIPPDVPQRNARGSPALCPQHGAVGTFAEGDCLVGDAQVRDRKSTRLNSSHGYISYAVFCLKKKKKPDQTRDRASG